ncbi:nuclear apoptosis-inducing factor 1 [Microtus ochrogaster]|uniref:Nuclear apoptosis-inducing factor 1 n=1 Tax=Microtus ochrogaster TaxID=79684 RepID=A0A8J6G6S8_MICOH|nr:nuclear apoptosis-inducing factor 1 [Microtus ochrogaster]KAH0505325.1 Nuclear apoptosis-inducing factor 1 [Microtus ochrogaster]
MAVPAKKRKMNFSEREVEIIVEELELKKHLLVNHFNAGVPLAAKSAAWHGILRRVNAVATCRRELPEVKKKWSDLKTEVRRKVAQVRAAVEGGEAPGPTEEDGAGGPGTGGGSGAAIAPVLLTPMQQRICNLLGEATIISLPSTTEIHPVALGPTATAAAATVTLTQIPTEAAFHTLEEGVVEYCTAEPPQPLPTEAPVEMITQHADASVKPQALKSRIALNSAKLIQEQRVTNLHIKEIAQHLEQQNDLLQMIRRSQEVQACAQERQAQAMEGTQAALSVLIQVLRPMIKDFRRYLQSNTPTPAPAPAPDPGQVAQNGQPDSILH